MQVLVPFWLMLAIRELRGPWTNVQVENSPFRSLPFSVTAARAWNALPSSVRSAPSLLQFRRDLKTALHVSDY